MAKRLIKIDLSQGPSPDGGDRVDLGGEYCRFSVLSLPGPCAYRLPSDPDGQFYPLTEGMVIEEIPTDVLLFDYEKGTGEVKVAAMQDERLDPNPAAEVSGLALDRREAFRAHVQAPKAATGLPEVQVTPEPITLDTALASGGAFETPSSTNAENPDKLSGMLLAIEAADGSNAEARAMVDGWYPSLGTYFNPHGFTRPTNRDHYHYLRSTVLCEMPTPGALAGGGTVMWGWGKWPGGTYNTVVGFGIRPSLGQSNWQAVVRNDNTYEVEEDLSGYPYSGGLYDMEVRVGIESGSPYVRWYLDGDKVHERSLPLGSDLLDHQDLQPSAHIKKTAAGADHYRLWWATEGWWEGGTVYV